VTSSPSSTTCTTKNTSCRIVGLRASTTYRFTVSAVNAVGSGEPTRTNPVRTAQAAPTAQPAPTGKPTRPLS
jgi:hypothetical protein